MKPRRGGALVNRTLAPRWAALQASPASLSPPTKYYLYVGATNYLDRLALESSARIRIAREGPREILRLRQPSLRMTAEEGGIEKRLTYPAQLRWDASQ